MKLKLDSTGCPLNLSQWSEYQSDRLSFSTWRTGKLISGQIRKTLQKVLDAKTASVAYWNISDLADLKSKSQKA